MNKLFKKLFVLLLALTVAFAAVGCDACNDGEDPGAGNTPTTPDTSVLQPEAPEITMMSQKELVIGDDFYLAPKTKNVKGDLLWSSSDPTVATVSNGVVSALKEGKTTVTASYEGVSASAEITVGYGSYTPNIATYSGIDAVDSVKTVLAVGNGYQLGAYVDFNNKTFSDATFTYASSKEEFLTVDANGVVTPINSCDDVKVTVTATWRKFTVAKTFSIDVRENVLFYSNNDVLKNLVINTPAVYTPVEERNNVINIAPSVKAGPEAIVDNNVSVEVVDMKDPIEAEYSYDAENKVYTALALGKVMINLSYAYEGKTYASNFTIEAVRPVKEIALPVELYSAGAGTYKVLDTETGKYVNKTLVDYAWGEDADITLYDAYQDGEELKVNGEIAKNILVNFDSYTDTAVTLGTKTEQYVVYLNDACSYYISDADDVIGAFEKTDEKDSEQSIGYYVFLNDVDMTDAPAIKNTTSVKFQGVVEGKGHSIINPVVDLSKEANKGFFGMMQSGSTVRNLAFININSIGHQPNVGWLTGVFSNNQKTITFENIYIDVNENMEHRGGMFVQIYGKLNNFVINQKTPDNFDGDEWIKTADAAWGYSLLARITSTVTGETNTLNNVYVISKKVLQYTYTDQGANKKLSEPSYTNDYKIAVDDKDNKIWNSTMTYGENETKLRYVYDYFTNSPSIGGLGLKNPTVQSVIQAMGGNGKISVAPNVRVYDSYSAMSVDTDEKHLGNLDEFKSSPYWTIVNGAPVWKGVYDNVEMHDDFFGITVGNQSVNLNTSVKNYSEYELSLKAFNSELVTDLTFSATANDYFDVKEIKGEDNAVIGYKVVTKKVSDGQTVDLVASFKYNGVAKTKTIKVEVVNPFDVAINEVISLDGSDIAIDGEYQFAISINGTPVENVTYSSNDATVLALKAETTDTFTALKEGTATISATFTYNDKAEVRDFVVNVIDPIKLSSYVQIGTNKVVNEISLSAYQELAVDVLLDSVAFDASKITLTSSNTDVVTVEGNVIKLIKYVENATSTINATLTEKGRTYTYEFVVNVTNPFTLSVNNVVAESHKLNLYSANALAVKVNGEVVENVMFTTTATNATIADGVLTVNALGANATVTATFNYGQNNGVVIFVPVTFYDAVVDNSVITVDGVELEETSISIVIEENKNKATIGVNYNDNAVEEVTLSGYDANAVTVEGTKITANSNTSFDLTVTYVVGGKNHVIVIPVACIYPSITIDTPVDYDASTGKLITTATLEGDIFGASAGGQQLSIGNGLTVDDNGITLRAKTSEADAVAGVPYITSSQKDKQVFEVTIQTNVNTYVFKNVTYWTKIIYNATDLREAVGYNVDYSIVDLGAADSETDREKTLNGKGYFVGTTLYNNKYYEGVYNVGLYKMAANVDMQKTGIGYINNPLVIGDKIGGFLGYFDGNGYTIDNYAADQKGLFGRMSNVVTGKEVNTGKGDRYVKYVATVKNLALTNVITTYWDEALQQETPILALTAGHDSYIAGYQTTEISNIYATVSSESTALGNFITQIGGNVKINNLYLVNTNEFGMEEQDNNKFRLTDDASRADATIASDAKIYNLFTNYGNSVKNLEGVLFGHAYTNTANAPDQTWEAVQESLDNITNTYVVTTMPLNYFTYGSPFAYTYSDSYIGVKFTADGAALPKADFYKLGQVSKTSGKAFIAIAYAANETVGNIPVMYAIKQSAIDDAKAIFAAGGSVGNSTEITSFMCDTCGEIAFTGSAKAPAVGKACASTTDCTGTYVNCANYQVPGGKGQLTTPCIFTFTYHTQADMADYYSDENGAYKLKNVKKYADANAMKAANNDYTSFTGETGNGLWEVVEGELKWVGAQA